jgi:hypothetical protein
MSGIATTLHEWVSIFCPRAADAGRLFGACMMTCLLVAAVLVFARQRSTTNWLSRKCAEARQK